MERSDKNGFVLITGAVSKIGKVLSVYLYRKGYPLILHYRQDDERIKSLKEELSGGAPKCYYVQAELTNKDDRKRMANFIGEAGIELQAVIHNASVFYPTRFDEIKEDNFHNFFSLNTIVPFLLTRELLSFMRKSADSCVINMVDIYGFKPIKNYLPYCLSKSALITLTKALAKEIAPIRVNGIAPGAIEFARHYTEEEKLSIIRNTLLKKKGTPENIAQTADFLISNDYITGQIIPIDGGKLIL